MPDRTRFTPTARSLNGRQHLLGSVIACTLIVPHVMRCSLWRKTLDIYRTYVL
jgi:hypothetical protein